MRNAIKFSDSGSIVRIGASLHRDKVRVQIMDAGSGIAAEFSDRIFQRFSQADSSDTRQKGGSGLGLSICKSIIDLHGGEIGYSSEVGKGSSFYFELQVENKSANAQA